MKVLKKIFFIFSIFYTQTILAKSPNLISESFSKFENQSIAEKKLRDISFS